MAGEVQRARASHRGHLYFELVEKGAGDRIVGKLEAVLWRSTHLRVRRRLAADGQRIDDGLQIRCCGRLDFYPPAGRLQLIVSDVDPLFTLGFLERRRRETLASLAAAQLLERNRALTLPEVPLRVGLVTSEGSAAYHDFLAGLAESGYGFRVSFVHAAVQGHQAENEVASALAALAEERLDCVALIRGGGARSDLAAFDSRRIAEAIARHPLPVLTGLGHEIDRSIADRVSHAAFTTPTKVAELLVARVAAADERLASREAALGARAKEVLRRARDAVRRLERLPAAARLRLQAARLAADDSARALELLGRRRLREAGSRHGELHRRLAASAPRLLGRHRETPEVLARRLAGTARGQLREARAVVDGVARLAAELAPERVLERGYSITRDAAGRIIRQPGQTAAGDVITTRLSGGVLKSRVEES